MAGEKAFTMNKILIILVASLIFTSAYHKFQNIALENDVSILENKLSTAHKDIIILKEVDKNKTVSITALYQNSKRCEERIDQANKQITELLFDMDALCLELFLKPSAPPLYPPLKRGIKKKPTLLEPSPLSPLYKGGSVENAGGCALQITENRCEEWDVSKKQKQISKQPISQAIPQKEFDKKLYTIFNAPLNF